MRVRKTIFDSEQCVRDFSSSKEFNLERCVIKKRKGDFSSSKEREREEICVVCQKKKENERRNVCT